MGFKVCRRNSLFVNFFLNVGNIAKHLTRLGLIGSFDAWNKLVRHRHLLWWRWSFRTSLLCLYLDWLEFRNWWFFLHKRGGSCLFLVLLLVSSLTSPKCYLLICFFLQHCWCQTSVILCAREWFNSSFWRQPWSHILGLAISRPLCCSNIQLRSIPCQCSLLFFEWLYWSDTIDRIFFLSRSWN